MVIDASALVELVLNTEKAPAVLRAVTGHSLFAPNVVDVEALSALRACVRSGRVSVARAEVAIADLVVAPVTRVPSVGLLHHAWAFRDNLSAYDAIYVALAARLQTRLVTADHRLARAPGLPVAVDAV